MPAWLGTLRAKAVRAIDSLKASDTLGFPRALLTDNGAAMLAAETTEGLERLSIVHHTTLPLWVGHGRRRAAGARGKRPVNPKWGVECVAGPNLLAIRALSSRWQYHR